MNFLELVKRRRSVRKYADRPIPRETIERCLEAARVSPSACNSQPWSFIVVDDPAIKRELADRAFSSVFANNAFAKNAPVLVIVITERSKYIARLGGYLKNVQYSLIDIGIVCEHFILQAEEEGVGTCWLGWFNEKAVKETLKIPPEKKVDVIISMGYPEPGATIEKPRNSMEEIRRYNVTR
ncbi:MAG: nitroreductase family protein [Candidatus Omnitrophota bacterium]